MGNTISPALAELRRVMKRNDGYLKNDHAETGREMALFYAANRDGAAVAQMLRSGGELDRFFTLGTSARQEAATAFVQQLEKSGHLALLQRDPVARDAVDLALNRESILVEATDQNGARTRILEGTILPIGAAAKEARETLESPIVERRVPSASQKRASRAQQASREQLLRALVPRQRGGGE